jgi:regulator of cell morphogenesis and NO signaling
MQIEHVEHGKNLFHLKELVNDFKIPAEACGSWSALIIGVEELYNDLTEHIHIENNILFPKALLQ